ncbi:hypothetical protein ACEQ8H_003207 [Pleosporales sp. CAS-2024a]
MYVIRRHHVNKARRSSTGSIYPKVAYLYDPPAGGAGRGGDIEEALMSGGVVETSPPLDNDSHGSDDDGNAQRKRGTISLSTRYSNAGNPFWHPEPGSQADGGLMYSHAAAPTDMLSALASASKGYRATSQDSPSVADFPVLKPAIDFARPWPTLDGDAQPTIRPSVLGEITSMACNLDPYSGSSQLASQRHSPTGLDSVSLYAPSTEANMMSRLDGSSRAQTNHPGASSMLCADDSSHVQSRCKSQLDVSRYISSNRTMVASESSSLLSNQQRISQTQLYSTTSLISPEAGAIHRGWDDIKRYSAEKVVPSVVSSYKPLMELRTPPRTKRLSFAQLRSPKSADDVYCPLRKGHGKSLYGASSSSSLMQYGRREG